MPSGKIKRYNFVKIEEPPQDFTDSSRMRSEGNQMNPKTMTTFQSSDNVSNLHEGIQFLQKNDIQCIVWRGRCRRRCMGGDFTGLLLHPKFESPNYTPPPPQAHARVCRCGYGFASIVYPCPSHTSHAVSGVACAHMGREQEVR